jgi:DNA-binding transcriptional ArsR family regulator
MVQQSSMIDAAFAALADPTRRGVLERLGEGEASITDLAGRFAMTLTGMQKHVRVLEQAGLLATEKVGRVRYCRLAPRRLDEATAWIAHYHAMLHARYDRLGAFLERTQGDPP